MNNQFNSSCWSQSVCVFTCCTSWTVTSSFPLTGILWAGFHYGNHRSDPTSSTFQGEDAPGLDMHTNNLCYLPGHTGTTCYLRWPIISFFCCRLRKLSWKIFPISMGNSCSLHICLFHILLSQFTKSASEWGCTHKHTHVHVLVCEYSACGAHSSSLISTPLSLFKKHFHWVHCCRLKRDTHFLAWERHTHRKGGETMMKRERHRTTGKCHYLHKTLLSLSLPPTSANVHF